MSALYNTVYDLLLFVLFPQAVGGGGEGERFYSILGKPGIATKNKKQIDKFEFMQLSREATLGWWQGDFGKLSLVWGSKIQLN